MNSEVSNISASKNELSDLLVQLGYGPITGDSDLSEWQDLDLELANPDRVLDFAEIYKTGKLNESQKYELGRLLLVSLDKAFEKYGQDNVIEEAGLVEKVLKADPRVHEYYIRYWACPEANQTKFLITPLIRRILSELSREGKI